MRLTEQQSVAAAAHMFVLVSVHMCNKNSYAAALYAFFSAFGPGWLVNYDLPAVLPQRLATNEEYHHQPGPGETRRRGRYDILLTRKSWHNKCILRRTHD